jgi:hypothetical protein
MNKKLLTAFLLLAVLPLLAGNSVFSYDGYPVQYYGTDIYSLGMGDTGNSDIFRLNTGYANPALHNPTNRTLFATGIQLGYTAYRSQDSDGTRHRFTDDSLDLPYFSLSVPLKSHRFGFQFNSFSTGVVSNQREFTLADGGSMTEKQAMDRYIYRADLIYSLRLGRLALGLSGNYYFGHDIRSFSQQADFGLFNTSEELTRTFKNPTLTLGALKYFDRISFGAYYTLPATLKGGEVRTSIHEQEAEVDYEYEVPGHLGAGLTVVPGEEIKLAADMHLETYAQIDSQDFENSWKVGVGCAYEPLADRHQSAFFRIPVRGGLTYRRLPFKADGNGIDETGFSLGLTLPLRREANRIDLGFQYLRRGNLDQNGLSDSSFMMMFGFTGFDIFGKGTDRTAPRDIPEKEDLDEW